MIFKTVIIGCGSIGALKLSERKYGQSIMTHAHAIHHHKETYIDSIIDPVLEKREEAKQKWKHFAYPEIKCFTDTYSFASIEAIQDADIVIISAPTDQHFLLLNAVIELRPGIIIAEKPFCNNKKEAELIQKFAKKNKVPILIDYIRRFVPEFQQIKKDFDNDKFGKALNCRVTYCRGFKHEACHALDFMLFLFGKFQNAQRNFSGEILDGKDPSFQVSLGFEKCQNVIFQPCDGRKYGVFEIDIFFEKKRIRLIDNGLYIEFSEINKNNEWGHKSISYKPKIIQTDLLKALSFLVDNAVSFLKEKTKMICTVQDAINVHKIIDYVEKQDKKCQN